MRVEQLLRQQGRVQGRRAPQRVRVGPQREREGLRRGRLGEPQKGRQEPLLLACPLLLQPLYRQPPFFPLPEK